MAKFSKDEVKKLLELVGGKENIAGVSHCVTRMRFVLKKEEKARVEEIEKLKSVKGTFTSAGQFQVIIGTGVGDFYKEFLMMADLNSMTKDEAKKVARKNMNGFERAISHLAEIFVPLLPAIIVGGLQRNTSVYICTIKQKESTDSTNGLGGNRSPRGKTTRAAVDGRIYSA